MDRWHEQTAEDRLREAGGLGNLHERLSEADVDAMRAIAVALTAGFPEDAIVVSSFRWSTRRTPLFCASATYTNPRSSTATARGWLSSASRAGPPSPDWPGEPFPALVVITPLR